MLKLTKEQEIRIVKIAAKFIGNGRGRKFVADLLQIDLEELNQIIKNNEEFFEERIETIRLDMINSKAEELELKNSITKKSLQIANQSLDGDATINDAKTGMSIVKDYEALNTMQSSNGSSVIKLDNLTLLLLKNSSGELTEADYELETDERTPSATLEDLEKQVDLGAFISNDGEQFDVEDLSSTSD